MATLKTVTGKLTGPDGAGVPCQVRAVLSAAANIVGVQELSTNASKVFSAGDGSFSLTLYSNGDMTPVGKYVVTATGTLSDGTQVSQSWQITVPQTAGPFEISNILS